MTENKKQGEEKETKKLLVVKARQGGQEYSVGNNNFYFAFVSSPEEGRVQATAVVTCRETLTNFLWRAYNAKTCSAVYDGYMLGKDASVDLNRLRLLIVIGDSKVANLGKDGVKEGVFKGKALLNIFEDIAGWEKSTISSVKHETHKNTFLITGPKEWLIQPQFLSLATWALRLCTLHPKTVNTDNYESFIASLDKLTSSRANEADIDNFAVMFKDKLYTFLKYHKEIFDGCTPEKAFDWNLRESFGCYTGLSYFFKTEGLKHVKELSKKFYKIHDEVKKKGTISKG